MKAVMNEAELYQKSNSLQRRDALKCLEEYVAKIRWRTSGDRVIDIGCGDGSVTSDILKTHIPENYEKLVGCDISEKMIGFANEHHQDDRTSFLVLDIEVDLPEELKHNFDHAFSFYTLHWIHQQEKAFRNIYDLLSPGGDCFLIFLGHMPVFDVYRIMATSTRWSHWLCDVEKYISPYHDSQEPEKEIKRMMTKIGFQNVDVQCKESIIVYDKLDILRKAVMAINPFSIPAALWEEFMDDYLDVVRDLRLMDEVNNNLGDEICIKANYRLLIAYGTKPKSCCVG